MALNKEPVKLAKSIMPAGFKDDTWSGSPAFSWYKRHGHAGRNMIERAVGKAKKLGFVSGKFGCHGTPDGSVMGSSEVFHHPEGWEMLTSSSYGCVAYDNSFSITLRKV